MFLLLVFLWSGCDRAFSDVGEPTLEVVSPDITVARTEDDLILVLRVESVRDVTRVRAGSIEFGHGSGPGLWQATLPLENGLNQFVIESFVDDGPTGLDTLNVFRLSYSVETPSGLFLPFESGSHTLTRLKNDDLLLVGGSNTAGGRSALDAMILISGTSIFRPVRSLSIVPRTGHTASLLPDGRVLFLGGALLGDIQTPTDLLEPVELYDPASGNFVEVPFSGQPIRRMYHSAILREINGQVFIVLFGGRGDIRYTPSPLIDIRQDMRTFQFRNDSLIALSPAVGPFIESMAGHTQTALVPGEGGRFLISGMIFGSSLEGASFRMDFDGPFGIDLIPGNTMNTPRIRHAAVTLAPGIVALFGGREADPQSVLGQGELYVEEVDTYFSLPFALTPRFGLTATALPDDRIMVLGGFGSDASALTTAEFVSLDIN